MPSTLKMNAKERFKAKKELARVIERAKKSHSENCLEMRSAFMGRMCGGSTGLYKWLSEIGNACSICCELECILQAASKLDRSLDTTRKLAGVLRDMAKQTLGDVTGHEPAKKHHKQLSNSQRPLPFFRRLEAALGAMASFNPADDEIEFIDTSNMGQAAVGAGGRASRNEKTRKREIEKVPAKRQAQPEVICIDDSDDEETRLI